MFGKSKTKKTTSPKKASSSGANSPTIISHDLNILGNIISDGYIDINGTIDGNIHCNTVTIRERGLVRGDVIGDTVHVHGKVEGLIKARHVTLHNNCHIEGIVMHESLSVEDGAFIDGQCKRMDKATLDKARKKKTDGISPAQEKQKDIAPSGSTKEPVALLKNIRLLKE